MEESIYQELVTQNFKIGKNALSGRGSAVRILYGLLQYHECSSVDA